MTQTAPPPSHCSINTAAHSLLLHCLHPRGSACRVLKFWDNAYDKTQTVNAALVMGRIFWTMRQAIKLLTFSWRFNISTVGRCSLNLHFSGTGLQERLSWVLTSTRCVNVNVTVTPLTGHLPADELWPPPQLLSGDLEDSKPTRSNPPIHRIQFEKVRYSS